MKVYAFLLSALLFLAHPGFSEPLAGTQALDWEGDIASRLVDSADAFLLKKIEQTMAAEKAKNPDRAELARILGVVDQRVGANARFEKLGKVAEGASYTVHEVRWQAFGDVHGEGLWLKSSTVKKTMIVIPDADQTPEECRVAHEYAMKGFNVYVPVLINRKMGSHKISNREFIYRPAYELGAISWDTKFRRFWLWSIDWVTT